MQRRTLLTASLLLTAANLSRAAQIPDFKPPTPLFEAIARRDAKAVTALLDQGASPNEGRFIGITPLLVALANSDTPTARVLLAHGADAKATDPGGSTALMWAVYNQSPDPALIEDLLRRGIDPNAANAAGETALTWAMRRGDFVTAARLRAAGVTDTNAIRGSVEKAVALLQKSGPEFVKVSGCVSCHHQSLPQLAYAAARERGMRVDEAIAEKEVKAVIATMKPIREKVEQGAIQLPNPGIGVSYLLLGLAAEGYAPDETTSALATAIARSQRPDGSFAVVFARPPMEESAFTSTALSVRALQRYGKDYEERVAKAREWLRQAQPATNEDHSMRVLGLVWSHADRSEIERASAELLAQQKTAGDGGWAQMPGLGSDAYATGQAMVALRTAGAVRVSDAAYQQGVLFLLRTQLGDGSWLVRTRSNPFQRLKDSGFPHGRDQWISAAGTSWAAWALALTQPEVQTDNATPSVP